MCNQYEKPMFGTLRVPNFGSNHNIRNKKKNKIPYRYRKKGITLTDAFNLYKEDIINEHIELLKQGYVYSSGCGRFREKTCTCNKCRNKSNTYFLLMNNGFIHKGLYKNYIFRPDECSIISLDTTEKFTIEEFKKTI